MNSTDKLLKMLQSSVPQIRMMAMERLSSITDLSPEIIQALEKNAQDANPVIAEKAKKILRSEADYQGQTKESIEMANAVKDNKIQPVNISEPFQEDPHSNLFGHAGNTSPIQQVNLNHRTQTYSLIDQVFHLTPQIHANLMSGFRYASFGLPVLFILPLCAGLGTASTTYFIILIILIFISQLLPFLIWVLPVYCEDVNCNGRVEKSRDRISLFMSEVEYRCTACGRVYHREIFDPRQRGTVK